MMTYFILSIRIEGYKLRIAAISIGPARPVNSTHNAILVRSREEPRGAVSIPLVRFAVDLEIDPIRTSVRLARADVADHPICVPEHSLAVRTAKRSRVREGPLLVLSALSDARLHVVDEINEVLILCERQGASDTVVLDLSSTGPDATDQVCGSDRGGLEGDVPVNVLAPTTCIMCGQNSELGH